MTCAFALELDYTMGDLSIVGNGGVTVEFITHAWQPVETGLLAFWNKYSKQRGTDIIVPGDPGSIPTSRRVASTVYTLPMVMIGDCDAAGTESSSLMIGYQSNMAVFTEVLNKPPAVSSPPLYVATFTYPDGTVEHADIRVPSITPAVPTAAGWNFTVDIEIPLGGFA